MLFWFPMLVFGLASLGAAFVAVVISVNALIVYWSIAGAAAGIATANHYHRRELEAGLVRSSVPYLATAALLGIGTFAAPFVIADDPAWAIAMWVALGYGIFAWLEHSSWVLATAGVLGALGLVLLLADLPHETAWSSAITGSVLIGGAAIIYPRELKL